MIDKRTCKFYNETRKRCNALNSCYCDRPEEKPCSFYKSRNEEKENGNNAEYDGKL